MNLKLTGFIFVLCFVFGAGFYLANETNAQGKAYKIGDRGPGGGFVFYDKGITSDGWRYLEAAPIDQATNAKWACANLNKYWERSDYTDLGTGQINTAAIIKSCGEAEIAAKFAVDYRGGGYSDWFLPSKDELNLMYTNLKVNGVGGFAIAGYWSSSQDKLGSRAWYQNFSNGYQYNKEGNYALSVRAVRAFCDSVGSKYDEQKNGKRHNDGVNVNKDRSRYSANLNEDRLNNQTVDKSIIKAGNEENLAPGTKRNHTVNGVTFTMVYCPPGSFRMGAPISEMGVNMWQALNNTHNIKYNEHPRNVRLTKGFWMLETEVTQELYQAVMGRNPSHFKGSKLPVESVSWFDAVEFCNKLSVAAKLTPVYGRIRDFIMYPNANGFRLPTEAEWEYAARAGTTTPFHYGNRLNSTMANFDGRFPYGGAPKGIDRERTINVKSFKPNAWGLFDMHGNVLEWCWDWYGPYIGDAIDPTSPVAEGYSYPLVCLYRVNRGGSWYLSGFQSRSAWRSFGTPNVQAVDLGFRIVQ